jgi:hypothetical protein
MHELQRLFTTAKKQAKWISYSAYITIFDAKRRLNLACWSGGVVCPSAWYTTPIHPRLCRQVTRHKGRLLIKHVFVKKHYVKEEAQMSVILLFKL